MILKDIVNGWEISQNLFTCMFSYAQNTQQFQLKCFLGVNSHVFKQTIFNFHTVYFKFVTNKKAKQKFCVINFKRASVELYPDSTVSFGIVWVDFDCVWIWEKLTLAGRNKKKSRIFVVFFSLRCRFVKICLDFVLPQGTRFFFRAFYGCLNRQFLKLFSYLSKFSTISLIRVC